ncbi:uncharacterized protein F4807DRAFT_407505 [Annulohypoxylon truncatum]|uniref:uncharacterized protein n=1 Tax=Annulohypoxylon truncatum TaxID=327061 RepID=UPI002007EEE6|nr:uncharacterized protein F4807DRAFT_407505 [Annulohypoxylon truncatum]KAI1214308.1 hypothetical protein F4807DRAFT_407505 [Annulohypoxylon truncatum]
MDKLSQLSVNGSAPSEAPSNTHTNRASFATDSTFAYAASVTRGDAPVNTLLQHGDTDSRQATRHTKVQHEVDNAMAKLSQTPAEYVPFPYPIKAPRIACRRGLSPSIRGRGVMYIIVG